MPSGLQPVGLLIPTPAVPTMKTAAAISDELVEAVADERPPQNGHARHQDRSERSCHSSERRIGSFPQNSVTAYEHVQHHRRADDSEPHAPRRRQLSPTKSPCVDWTCWHRRSACIDTCSTRCHFRTQARMRRPLLRGSSSMARMLRHGDTHRQDSPNRRWLRRGHVYAAGTLQCRRDGCRYGLWADLGAHIGTCSWTDGRSIRGKSHLTREHVG